MMKQDRDRQEREDGARNGDEIRPRHLHIE